MVVFSGCFVQELVLGWEFCTERLSSPSVLSRNDRVLSRFCCNDAWQVAMASSRKIFEPLPLHYKWCGFVSVVLGCAGMWTLIFSAFGEEIDVFGSVFHKLIRAGSCSLTRSGSIHNNCGLRTHFCYCFRSLLRNRTCGRLELRLREKVTTEGIDATDSLFMKAKPPVHGSCTLR